MMVSIDSLAEHEISVDQYENFCDLWRMALLYQRYPKRFAKHLFTIKKTLELSDEQLMYLIEMEE